MKMHVLPEGPNQTVLVLGGMEVLFSYRTPVAAFIPGRGYIKTSEKHSATTSKHINKWTPGNPGEEPQEFFDELLSSELKLIGMEHVLEVIIEIRKMATGDKASGRVVNRLEALEKEFTEATINHFNCG